MAHSFTAAGFSLWPTAAPHCVKCTGLCCVQGIGVANLSQTEVLLCFSSSTCVPIDVAVNIACDSFVPLVSSVCMKKGKNTVRVSLSFVHAMATAFNE